ncbi:MAG TPA: metallophosphoesterase [Bacillota bacterium]|nr:metallophosphoesterase [Bacillota bacterium]
MFRLIKNILRLILLLIAVGAILVVYARYVEPHMLTVKDVTVASPRITADADNLKIAVFGDTHFGDYYTVKDFRKVVGAIGKMKPDVVVFTGDLIDNYDLYSGDTGKISGMLSEIQAPHGKYAIFGNHDYGGGAENKYQAIMEAGGFTVLKNNCLSIQKLGITIIGIDDAVIGYGDPSVASWGRPDHFNIVLAHEPDLIDQMMDYNVDLMISGHTHGRQINLKLFDRYILPSFGKEYVSGSFRFSNARNSELYVNSGVGTTKLPFRLFSPPELTCITLKQGDDSSDP